jgi:hypothetical protein
MPAVGDFLDDGGGLIALLLLKRRVGATQIYLAASDAAYQLLADADLDYRDEVQLQFVIDNVIQAAAPAKDTLMTTRRTEPIVNDP